MKSSPSSHGLSLSGNDEEAHIEIFDSISDFIRQEVLVFKTDPNQVSLVLEGSTPKPRHLARDSKEARLSTRPRAICRSNRPSAKARATKLIARWMGRPNQLFNALLADPLTQEGWTVLHCADRFQADTAILNQATRGDSVLSTDRDFLVFCRPASIAGIVFRDPLSRSPHQIRVADVFEASSLTQTEFQVA